MKRDGAEERPARARAAAKRRARTTGAAVALALLAAACSRESARRPGAAGAREGHDAGAPPAPPPEDILVDIELRPGELDIVAVERMVTAPVEEALGRVRALASLRSITSATRVRVAGRVNGAAGADAAKDAADALRRLSPPLPPAASAPLVTRRPSLERARWLLASSTWSQLQLAGLRDEMIRPALLPLAGVASVALCGGGQEVVRVRVDAERLRALGLDLLTLHAALTRSTLAPFRSIEDVASAPVGQPDHPLSLSSAAMVERTMTDPPCWARSGDGRDVLSIEAALDADAGPLADAEQRVRERIAALAAQLPAGVEVTPFAPASRDIVELGFEPAAADPLDVRQLSRILAAVPGVIGVLVQTGHPFGTADPPEAPDIRAVVAVAEPAAVEAVIDAADLPAAGLRVLRAPRADLRIQLLGSELDLLDRAAEAVVAALKPVPGVAAAGSRRVDLQPRIEIVPDVQRASARGYSADDVALAAHIALHGATVASLAAGGRAIPVRLELSDEPNVSWSDRLGRVELRGKGAALPLSSIATVILRADPAVILHIDRRRGREVWLRPARGAALAQVVAEARRVVEAAGALPAGVEIRWPELPPAPPPAGAAKASP